MSAGAPLSGAFASEFLICAVISEPSTKSMFSWIASQRPMSVQTDIPVSVCFVLISGVRCLLTIADAYSTVIPRENSCIIL